MRVVRGILSFLLAVILLGSLLTAALALSVRYVLTPTALADSLTTEGVLRQVQDAMVASAPALLDVASRGDVPAVIRSALTPTARELVHGVVDPIWLRGAVASAGQSFEKSFLSDTPPTDITIDVSAIRNRLLQLSPAAGGLVRDAAGAVVQQIPAQVKPFGASAAAGVRRARQQYRLAAHTAPLIALLAAVLLMLTAGVAAWRWIGSTLIVMAFILAATVAAAAVVLPVEMNGVLASARATPGLLGVVLAALRHQQMAPSLAGALQLFLLRAWPVPAGAFAVGLTCSWVGARARRTAADA